MGTDTRSPKKGITTKTGEGYSVPENLKVPHDRNNIFRSKAEFVANRKIQKEKAMRLKEESAKLDKELSAKYGVAGISDEVVKTEQDELGAQNIAASDNNDELSRVEAENDIRRKPGRPKKLVSANNDVND